MKVLDRERDGGAAEQGGGEGCAYPVMGADGAGRCIPCGAPRRPGSSYCAEHHALCHVSGGSVAEHRRLREAEALARAVGGRRGRPARLPPERFLRRLERAAQFFLRPNCSCYVRKDRRL